MTQFNLYQRLAIWLLGLLLLTKFSPIAALLTVLVVSLQVVLGESLLVRFSSFNHISSLAKVGLGFCLGATASTFVYVLVLTFSNTLIAVSLQIVLFVWSVWSRVGLTRSVVSHATNEDLGVVKWLAVVALLGLSPNWFWTLPVAIWLAVLFITWPRIKRGSNSLRLVFGMLGFSSGLFLWLRILDTRPVRPWFADDRFAEIFSFSLGKWGLSHNPMMISENISYHWFSFAWIGVLSKLSGTNIDVAFVLFGPVVIAMACAILGFAVIKTFTPNLTTAIFALVFAVSMDTERLFEGYGFNAFQLSSFSQFFSLALGLALLLMLVTFDNLQLNSLAVIIGFVLAGLIGAKISSGLVATAGLGGVWLFGLFRQRKIMANLKFLFIGVIIPGLIALVVFYGDPRNGSGTVIRRPGWPVGVSRNLWDIYNGSLIRFIPILIFLTLAFGAFGFMGLAIILKTKNSARGFRNSQVFLGFGLIISLLQMVVWGGGGGKYLLEGNVNTLYALHFWISLTRFIAIAIVLQQFSLMWRSQVFRKIILACGVLNLVSLPIARSWEVDFEPSYLIPFLTSLKPVIPFLLALLFAPFVSVVVRSRQSLGLVLFQNSFLVITNMALITSGIFLFVSNYESVSIRQQKEWRSMDIEYLVSPDIEAATNWLKFNTPDDAIIASKVTRVSPRVAVLTDRRDFSGVQESFRIFGEHSSDYKKHQRIIDQFGINGLCESASGLRAAKVDFFIVDILNAETPDISRCADEVFRNKGTVVYSLARPLVDGS